MASVRAAAPFPFRTPPDVLLYRQTLRSVRAALDPETAARCRALLAERFEVVTSSGQSTLVSFRVEGDSAEMVRRLYERGVVVRDVPGTGWIRVSCGWWTNDDDLERLLAALTVSDTDTTV